MAKRSGITFGRHVLFGGTWLTFRPETDRGEEQGRRLRHKVAKRPFKKVQFLTATKHKPEIPVLMLGGYELL